MIVGVSKLDRLSCSIKKLVQEKLFNESLISDYKEKLEELETKHPPSAEDYDPFYDQKESLKSEIEVVESRLPGLDKKIIELRQELSELPEEVVHSVLESYLSYSFSIFDTIIFIVIFILFLFFFYKSLEQKSKLK